MRRLWTLVLSFSVAACTGNLIPSVPKVPPTPEEVPATPVEPMPPVPPEACVVPKPMLGAPVPLRRLNRTHVENTVRELFGVTEPLVVPDEKLFAYRSNISSSVDDSSAQAYLDFAERVLKKVAVSPCSGAGCTTWLLDTVGPRLFRRPLDAATRSRYQALFQSGVTAAGAAEGVRWVLEAMLQSPLFLYIDEPVDSSGLLDGYGVATRLSLAFFGTNPDAALLAAAARGDLETADGIRAAARSMLADARSIRGLDAFVSQWLDLERLTHADARPDLNALGPTVLSALAREPIERTRASLVGGGGLSDLLTSPKGVDLPELASLYGADRIVSSTGAVSLDSTKRAGLLTLPGVMASLAHAHETSPTVRGYAVLANLLCTPPPPPPAGLIVTLPPSTPGATMRQRLEAHFSAPSCASCHKSMDGLGFGFERYDSLGRSRTLDNGNPIDDRASFKLSGENLTANGAIELSALLGQRSEVRECFTRQWARYALGALEPEDSTCFMQTLSKDLSGPNGLAGLWVELAASDYMRKGRPL